MLLCKRADGAFIYGPNLLCEYPAGNLVPVPDLENQTLQIEYLDGRVKKYHTPVAEFQYIDEDGNHQNYTNLEALFTNCAGFFFRRGNGVGNNSPWKEFEIVGADGVETGQDPLVITGTTDFNLPTDCDVTKAMIVLNPFKVSYTLVVVGGIDKIRFTQAPRVGDTPSIFYQIK